MAQLGPHHHCVVTAINKVDMKRWPGSKRSQEQFLTAKNPYKM